MNTDSLRNFTTKERKKWGDRWQKKGVTIFVY